MSSAKIINSSLRAQGQAKAPLLSQSSLPPMHGSIRKGMRDPQRLSYAVADPDKHVATPWRKHRFPNRVTRVNFAGEEQQVVFATASQRDQFLRNQKSIAPPIVRRRKQGCYGSHPRHNFNRKHR